MEAREDYERYKRDTQAFSYMVQAGWTDDQIQAWRDSFEPEFDPAPTEGKYYAWKKELQELEDQIKKDDETGADDIDWGYVGPRTYWLERNIKRYEEREK